MFKSTNQLRGFIIALVVGVGFVTLAVVYLDTESSALMAQLVGVFILIFGLIGLAALLAWLGRFVVRKVKRK